jgi:hypothetical protein
MGTPEGARAEETRGLVAGAAEGAGIGDSRKPGNGKTWRRETETGSIAGRCRIRGDPKRRRKARRVDAWFRKLLVYRD